MSRILFTICGRAGSKGFQNKNLKELKGVPLIYYSLAAVDLYNKMHSGDQVTVALNTDCPELMEQASRQQVIPNIWFVDRKKELAGDKVAKVHVIQDTYFQMCDKGYDFDIVIDLDLTSPLRRTCDIDGVIAEIKRKEDFDLAFSVVSSRRSPYFNMVEQKKDGFYRKICDSEFTARQQVPKSYELNASIYAFRPRFLQKTIDMTILDYRCSVHEMVDYLVLDIDSENDFKALEYLIDFHCEQDQDIKKLFLDAQNFL